MRPATLPSDCCDAQCAMKPFVPRELDKATSPAYRIEPPDVLKIEIVQRVSQATYSLHVGDTVVISVTGTFPDEPISGEYLIGTGGVVDLGPTYGTVEIAGLRIDDAAVLLESHLRKQLREPRVSMSLRSVANVQRLAGEFIVVSDGTISLGPYGSVSVVGQTLDEARMTIANHVAPHFSNAQVSLSVHAFNSKAYYIVMQGGGMGDQLVRFPCTGNETVMDALSQVNGLGYMSSCKMWIARPDRDCGSSQILPIDWIGITQRADVETNYQLMPGDRLYVAQDRLVAFDTKIAKLTLPFERIFRFAILGTSAASRLSGKVLNRSNDSLLTPLY